MMTNFGSTLGLEKRARPKTDRPVYSAGPLIRWEMTLEERLRLETMPVPPQQKRRRPFTDVTEMTVSRNKIKKQKLGI
ncbi:hypothetical protein EEL30_01045 (plasmid) [Brevibacillus laterosporus]|uniref:Uncharacterized protein n=1 Tax=Brevibacillus laterosporus TaxID=1465 RepID=A0A518V297_BRELA|nr:hypothetical protein EEL30_01045 [Brevibacillus laterosporus]